MSAGAAAPDDIHLPLLDAAPAGAWTRGIAADVSRAALCDLAECARVLCEPDVAATSGHAALAALLDQHAALCPLLLHLLAIACVQMPYDSGPLHVAALARGLAAFAAIYAGVVAAQLSPPSRTAVARLVARAALPLHLVDLAPPPPPPAPAPLRRVPRGVALHTYHDGACRCAAQTPLQVAFAVAPGRAPPEPPQLLATLAALHPPVEGQAVRCTLARAGAAWLFIVWTLSPGAAVGAWAARWAAALEREFGADLTAAAPDPLLVAALGPGGARQAEGAQELVARYGDNLARAELAQAAPRGAQFVLLDAEGELGAPWTDAAGRAWRVLAPAQLPQWLGGRARAHVEALRRRVVAEHKGKPARLLEALRVGAAAELAAPLYAAFFTNMQQRASFAEAKVRRAERAPASVLWQRADYRQVEQAVAADPQLAYRFFCDLVAGESVRASGHGWVQAGGHLSFCIEGERALRWVERGARHGEATDCGLGSLVMHRSSSQDASEALGYVLSWWHARDGARPEAPSPAVERAMKRTADTDRERIAKLLAQSGAVAPGTAAHRYLREVRGLADAPRALIEENPHLRAAPLYWRDADGEPWRQLGGMLAVAEGGDMLQRTYLEPDTARKCAHVGQGGRLQLGAMLGADRLAPGVCVQRPAGAGGLHFVAEGVETALSVAAAYPDAGVYATLGKSTLGSFAVRDRGATLVVCRENDKPETAAAIEADMRRDLPRLRQRAAAVRCVWPPREVDGAPAKDFNDVHQRRPGAAGTALIRECIDAQLATARGELKRSAVDLTHSTERAPIGDAKRRCINEAVADA